MKIKEITKEKDTNIYNVTLKPDILEWLLFRKEKTIRVKEDFEYSYKFWEGGVYFYEDGSQVGVAHPIRKEIEKFKRRF